MNYENQICPYCGKPFKGDDDVVVCPVCATPQHRECWVENGRCANEELHASGFSWERKSAAGDPSYGREGKTCPSCGGANPPDAVRCEKCGAPIGENAKNVCAFCGNENDADAAYCKYCGAPLGERGEFLKSSPYLINSGIDPEEKIDGITADDLAAYVQTGSRKYIPKFKRIAAGKKLSFNFAAFFFSPYWFFYRKLYKAGVFLIVLFASAALALSSFSDRVATAASEYLGAAEAVVSRGSSEAEIGENREKLDRAREKFYKEAREPLAITTSVNVAIRLACALAANRLYYKKATAELRAIDESYGEKNLKTLAAARRGGISALAFAASLLGYNMLLSLLAFAAESMIR